MPSVRVTPNRLHADEHNTKQNLTAKGRNKVHTHTQALRFIQTQKRYVGATERVKQQ